MHRLRMHVWLCFAADVSTCGSILNLDIGFFLVHLKDVDCTVCLCGKMENCYFEKRYMEKYSKFELEGVGATVVIE